MQLNYGQRETMQQLMGHVCGMPSVSPTQLTDLYKYNYRAKHLLLQHIGQQERNRVLERDETVEVTKDITHILEIPILNGDMPTLQLLLEYYKVIPESSKTTFDTHLIILFRALEHHPELVNCILTHGTFDDKNKILNQGNSPHLLGTAITNNSYEATEALLEHGALLHNPYFNYLSIALNKNLIGGNNDAHKMIALILHWAKKQNCLWTQLEGFKRYFDQFGAIALSDHNKKFNHLCYAAKYGTLELVMLLIVSGSDITYKDGRGGTIEQIAREVGNIDIAQHVEKLKRANPAVIWAKKNC